MNKITEMIPDDLPEWAQESMASGHFFATAINKVRRLEERLGKRKFEFVKQNDGHSCYACCAAMATGKTLQDIIDFVGHDGNKDLPESDHPDNKQGFSLEEINLYLATHGLTFGAVGIDLQAFSDPKVVKDYSHFEVHVQVNDYVAIIIVKSLRFEGIRHALYWDGKVLYDPNIGEVKFDKYHLLEWWPLFDYRKDL